MKRLELTPYQKNIWNRYVAMKGTAICNVGGYIYSDTMTDYELWQKVIQQLVKKSSDLRLCMTADGYQYETEYTGYQLAYYDRRGSSREEIYREMQCWMSSAAPVEHTLLCDFRYIEWDKGMYLFGRFNHLTMDGVSFSNLVKRIERIYLEIEEGGTETTEPDENFLRECMENQGKMQLDKAREKYRESWKEEVTQWKHQCIFKAAHEAETVTMTVPANLHENIKNFTKEQKISTEALLFAAAGILLRAYGGEDEIIIGRNVLNRRYSQMQSLGMYVNTQAVAVETARDDVKMLIDETAHMLMNKMRCSAYSFGDWKQDMGLDGAVFDLMISYRSQRFLPRIKYGEIGELENGSVETPLCLKWNEEETKTEVVLSYSVQGFQKVDAERFLKRLFQILQQIIKNPQRKVAEISVFCEEDMEGEAERKGEAWEYTRSVVSAFLEHVSDRKESVFIEDEEGILTGRDILRFCSMTVDYLKETLSTEKADRRTGLIGLAVPRSRYLPVLMMSALMAGYGFLPVNEKDGEKIQREIREHCDFIITPAVFKVLLAREKSSVECVTDRLWEAAQKIEKDQIAYGIYTSGTTGKPKAALNTHEGLACRLEWMSRYFGEGGRYLQKTRKTFDVSIWELLLPLTNGEYLFVAADGREADVAYLAETMQKQKITKVHFVPSVLAVFLKYLEKNPKELSDLKYVFCSGEALTPNLAEKVYELLPDVSLYNLYGPAECAIDVTVYACQGGEKEIPIGKAVPGVEVCILNKKREEVPIGVEGEICIAGKQTGAGYLDAATREEERFIQRNGKRYYRTRDRGKYGYDNQIYFLGRLDSEVKVRGMRINLEYVEKEISKCPGVLQAVACEDKKRLIVFYVSESGKEVNVFNWVRKSLTEHSIPDKIIKVREIPMGNHGKVNREKLKELIYEKKETKMPSKVLVEKIQNALMQQIPEGVKVGESVFEAGLTSLGVAEFVMDLNSMGIPLTYQDIYAGQTLEKIAQTAQKNMAHTIQETEKLIILRKDRNPENIFVCFPYAGGGAECFEKFAEGFKDKDVQVWVYCQAFGKDGNIEEDLKELAYKIPKKSRIHVMGYCGGAAAGFAFLDVLKQTERKVSTFWLCAASLYKNLKLGRREVAVWDLLPAFAGKRILDRIYGGKLPLDKKGYDRFRKEIRRAQSYMEVYKSVHKVPTYLIYAEKDPLTPDYRKNYKVYHRYIKHDFIICEIPEAGHYFMEQSGGRLAQYAWQKLKEKEKI